MISHDAICAVLQMSKSMVYRYVAMKSTADAHGEKRFG
jgi:hypothetical protein